MTEQDQADLRAYREGKSAFRDGLAQTDCPYDKESGGMLRHNWTCGYEDGFAEFAESFAGGNEA